MSHERSASCRRDGMAFGEGGDESVQKEQTMSAQRRVPGIRGIPAIGAVLLCAVVAGPLAVLPKSVFAQAEDGALKATWQARYRNLRQAEVQLKRTIEDATKEYADANRRNYRRSGVRHAYQAQASNAKAELGRVEKEISGIYDEARRAGIPLTWLYEVEEETVTPDMPSAEARKNEDHREGRNPLYHNEASDPDDD